eukprot:UN05772
MHSFDRSFKSLQSCFEGGQSDSSFQIPFGHKLSIIKLSNNHIIVFLLSHVFRIAVFRSLFITPSKESSIPVTKR